MASIVSFVSAIAAPQAHSPHVERKGSVLAAQQQHQCEQEEKGLSTSAITDGLLTMPFLQPPMVGYTCRASSVAASCPGLVDAGLDSSGEPSAAATGTPTKGTDWSSLLIPPNTHLLFHGPSYLSEIISTAAAANMHSCERAVCLLPADLSVQCSPHGCPEIRDSEGVECRALRYEYCNGATLTHIGFLDGSPPMEDDVVNGLHDEWRAAFPERAHAFGMIGHGREYFDEKDNASKERRQISVGNFLDSDGVDMCIQGGGASNDEVTLHASGYLECAARVATWSRMAAHGSENATLVVPWHITPPEPCFASPSPSPSPSPPSRRVYFTRCLVEQHDCRAVDWAVEQRSHQRLRTAQEETGKGGESELEQLPTVYRDETSDESGAFLMNGKAGIGIAGHQCAAVCERELGPVVTASSGCSRVYAGSIFLMVEQLLQLVR